MPFNIEAAAEYTGIPAAVIKQDIAQGTLPYKGKPDAPKISRAALSPLRYDPQMTPEEASAYCGLEAGTIRFYCRRGEFKGGAIQKGRSWLIRRSALDRFEARDKTRSGRPRNSEVRA
jgi:excisionase family DNA binding protein